MNRQPQESLFAEVVAQLSTSSFAFVMATGIVASALTAVAVSAFAEWRSDDFEWRSDDQFPMVIGHPCATRGGWVRAP